MFQNELPQPQPMPTPTIRVVYEPPWAMIVFLIFMVLKLNDVIGWSWWWVTAPLWVSAALMSIGAGMIYVANRLKIGE